jgi:hypothetical protein
MQLRSLWVSGLGMLITMWSQSVEAEQPKVSIGAIIRLPAQIEAEQARETQALLSTTEARAAEAFIQATDIEYLDRVSMDSLVGELQLSCTSLFNSSTGPASGLLGRLDFLVIVESTVPTSIQAAGLEA